MLKLSDNPPVFAEGLDPFQAPGRWWVAHTRSRCEKALAWDLVDRQQAYFLPMVDRISISGGKKRRARIPLFASHVFLKGDLNARPTALATGRVCRVMDVIDQAGIDRELRAIQKALAASIRLDPYDQPIAGENCRITAGPLAGFNCTVLRYGRLATATLPLTILRAGALMQIDPAQLERLPVSPAVPFARPSLPVPLRPRIAEQAESTGPSITRFDIDRLRMGKNYVAST
jgi:transcription antitermination factor NusG